MIMKKSIWILVSLFVWGCVDAHYPMSIEEIEYIDYSNCLEENLTDVDRLLLESISFEAGQLYTSLDIEAARQKGVSEKKYGYFLEYLQYENQRIKEYLNSGAIVFYNGQPYASNEDMLLYVDMSEEMLSRTGYYDSVALVGRTSIKSGTTQIAETYFRFNGPHFIDIRMDGSGTIQLIEESKGFEAYLIHTNGIEGAQFVWGAGDDIYWNWKVRYLIGSGYTAWLYAYGHWSIPFPNLPGGSGGGGVVIGGISGNIYDANNPIYTSRFPSAVRYYLSKEKRTIEITINATGEFQILVYRVYSNGTSSLYTSKENCNGYETYTLSCPLNIQYRVLINKKKNVNGKVSYGYYGDKLFPPIIP